MKINKILIITFLSCAFLLPSCTKWLDIKPRLETEREELYSSEQGFKDALTGCYTLLKKESLFGSSLSYSSLEYMAQHWEETDNSGYRSLNYKSSAVKTTFKTAFNELYTVIAQANDILYYLDYKGHESIKNEQTFKLLKGEALAIRAFCHFELLRIFGQVPSKATLEVYLTYAERASENREPSYDFDGFVDKLFVDLFNAEKLLAEADPLLRYTFDELNDPVRLKQEGHSDFGDGFRRVRFNYWAVKALTARLYNYVGDKSNAYEYAKSVIEGKVASGQSVITISNSKLDFTNAAYTMPSETLFAVHVYDLEAKTKGRFEGETAYSAHQDFSLFTSAVFGSETSDLRLRTFMAQSITTSNATRRSVICKKFWQNKDGLGLGGNLSVNGTDNFITMQLIPIIRLSEMYLIAAESAPSMAESNRLMREYKTHRDIMHKDYNTIAQRTNDIFMQYNAEFWAEGQMFYFYKRTKAKNMLWGFKELTEEDYVVPIPDGEL